MSKSVVVVTGCTNGGIGAALVQEFLKQGHVVYATARKLSNLTDSEKLGARILELDVTVKSSIDNAVAKIIEEAGKIDILVNNAGYGLFGPVIELGLDDLRKIYETNVFGQISVAQSVSPHMVSRGRGKIVNIGSISGITCTPYAGAYCSTKAALHSLSDALRMELKPFGISVMVVCPGAIKTNFTNKCQVGEEVKVNENSLYAPVKKYIAERSGASQDQATSPEVFARATVAAIVKENPVAYYFKGSKSFYLPLLTWLLPVFILDFFLSRRAGLFLLRKRKLA